MLPDRTYCHWHDPDRQAAARESRRKGGLNRSYQSRARKLLEKSNGMVDVQGMLLLAMVDVRNGDMEPGVATAMATLARAVIAVSGVAAYEERLNDMQRQIAELRGA